MVIIILLGCLQRKSLQLLSLLLFSTAVSAQNCEDQYLPVKKKLAYISASLLQTHDKQAYSSHVRQRYEDVAILLFLAESCAEDTQLTGVQQRQWIDVAGLLVTLQSSAKSSAFTDFEDWMTVKQGDISAYRELSQAW